MTAQCPDTSAADALVTSEEPSLRQRIDDFLAQERIAFVGLSTNPRDFSHAVFRELAERGYTLIPVNPAAEGELEGLETYRSVRDIPERPDAALLMTPAAASADVVAECIAVGIPRIWLHRGVGQGSVSDEAIARCEQAHVSLVSGQCPLMFLREPGWVHKVHAFGKKLTGSYPRA